MAKIKAKHSLDSFKTEKLGIIKAGKIFFFCSIEDYDWLVKFRWYPKQKGFNFYFYRKVVKNGQEYRFWAHREISKPQNGEDVHHINNFTLDNRRENLQNIPHDLHAQIF